MEAKKAKWEQAKYAAEEHELRAPADGKVLRLMTSVGDLFGQGPREPAIIFCPSGPRIIRTEVEQEFASKVQIGQTAIVEDDARLSGKWRGKVTRISDWYSTRRSMRMEPRQFNDVRTLECIVELEHSKDLRIGRCYLPKYSQSTLQRARANALCRRPFPCR